MTSPIVLSLTEEQAKILLAVLYLASSPYRNRGREYLDEHKDEVKEAIEYLGSMLITQKVHLK